MAPRVSVVLGKQDYYTPDSLTVHLSTDTMCRRDEFAIFRACHEAGHACQHRMNTWLWRMRNEWVPVLTGLWFVCGFMAFATGITNFWISTGFCIAAVAILLLRAGIIVRCEQEATELALDWIEENLAPEEDDMSKGRAYLNRQSKSYWRVLIGR